MKKTTVYTKLGSGSSRSRTSTHRSARWCVILRIVRTCKIVDPTLELPQPDIEEGRQNSGHEAIGIVEEIGEVITTVKSGDFVIAPSTHGCMGMWCLSCWLRRDTCDRHIGTNWIWRGAGWVHAPWIRQLGPLSKFLGKLHLDYTEAYAQILLTLKWWCRRRATMRRVLRCGTGDKVIVIGDGAVGQCAVIAAKMRGAPNRPYESPRKTVNKWPLESGATAVVALWRRRHCQGPNLGRGADALECVGTAAAVDQALGVLHNGGRGFVGVPHYNKLRPWFNPLLKTFQ